jgi:hypothetical protein
MFTLSDIIDAKQALIDHYNSPEYIQEQLHNGYSEGEIGLMRWDKAMALHELTMKLCDMELKAQKATSPVNIGENG